MTLAHIPTLTTRTSQYKLFDESYKIGAGREMINKLQRDIPVPKQGK